MSTSTGKQSSQKAYRKAQTTLPSTNRGRNGLYEDEEETSRGFHEPQIKPRTTRTKEKSNSQPFHEVVEEKGEKRRELRGIFREQAEPEEPFEPVEEPIIFSFRRLEEIVRNSTQKAF